MDGYRCRKGLNFCLIAILVFLMLIVALPFSSSQIVQTILEGSIHRQLGDIHPGGSGEVDVTLKNVSPYNVYVHEIRLFVETVGFVGNLSLRNPIKIASNETKWGIWVPIKLPPTSPIGYIRSYAQAMISLETNPLHRFWITIPSICCINSLPFRSFTFYVKDFFGENTVPSTIVMMKSYATGMEFTYDAKDGSVIVSKLADGYYEVTVWYKSPYDGSLLIIHWPKPYHLQEIASTGMLVTEVFDVQVKVKDLAGRPLDATVYLGNISQPLHNGFAIFNNVPKGTYSISVEHRGVEVYKGKVIVTSPTPPSKVGAYVDVVAQVGDLILDLRNADGKKILKNFTVRIDGVSISEVATGKDRIAFEFLPIGDYDIKVYMYNQYLGKEVNVGSFKLKIPKDIGENVLYLLVFDGRLIFKDQSGEILDIRSANVNGKEYLVKNGVLELPDATEGNYTIKASWMDVTVFDNTIFLSNDIREIEVKLNVYDVSFNVKTMDGSPLLSGTLTVSGIGFPYNATFDVLNGEANVYNIPLASYNVTVTLWDTKVFSDIIDVRGKEYNIIAKVYTLNIAVKNQFGRPIENAELSIGKLKSITNRDGIATIGQVPFGKHKIEVSYRGLKIVSTSVDVVSSNLTLTVPLYSINIKILGELGYPIDAEAELTRDYKVLERKVGNLLEFRNLPSGTYTLRVSKGAFNVERVVTLPMDRDLTITLPIALEIGGIALSMQDLYIIMFPLIASILITIVVMTWKSLKSIKWKIGRLKR